MHLISGVCVAYYKFPVYTSFLDTVSFSFPGADEQQGLLLECIGRYTATSFKLLSH